ncbi:hypothetical protein OnM2_067024 [Erysiphe neolycopersici]|uniref:Uncharacterized protein n=1 Tax=Erysiphe neolycopersici TaxID=212602 RepID=A0A420HLX9_9PEZI|nr:hypothetical protein OnM2_067024 [Erysiphe neolycopersici]
MAIHTISQQDLVSFYSSHFSSDNIDYFSRHFIEPERSNDPEDDCLGYYEDGTKRTLTDEQIAIFRHSELHRLLREKKLLAEKPTKSKCTKKIKASNSTQTGENQVLKSSTCAPKQNLSEKPLTNRARKALKAKQKGYFRQVIKPDLRKRTWDKVEVGLESLDYDEFQNASTSGATRSAQRRRVTYDD